MTNKIFIFGTGEIGELAHYYFTNDSDYQVVGFCCDDDFVRETSFKQLPVVGVSDVNRVWSSSEFTAHVALSYNKLNQTRKEKYFLLKSLGYLLPSYVCSKSVVWPDLKVGDNCFILENQTIQPTVSIGNNVMVWSGNHLGHRCIIGDHTYISSHVCIAGHTVIGESCFLGVNACFKDFLLVGDSVFVGMGAVVTRNVETGSVVIGHSGQSFLVTDVEAINLKKRYFDL